MSIIIIIIIIIVIIIIYYSYIHVYKNYHHLQEERIKFKMRSKYLWRKRELRCHDLWSKFERFRNSVLLTTFQL